MCGIYGFQNSKTQEFSPYEATVITHTLAKEMEYRGKDSFGAITLPDGQIYKGLGKVSSNAIKLLKAASNSRCFLAHTRTATVGEITLENSHPFKAGDVVGVHNGSIHNYKELNTRYSRDCHVDSEHIFHHLNDGLPLDEIKGHGTFFWSRDSEDFSKIYFGRTVGGSLTVAKVYRGNPKDENNEPIGVVWCSETLPISKALMILGLDYVEVIIKPKEIFYVEGGEVFNTQEPFEVDTINTDWMKWFKNGSKNCTTADTEDDDVINVYTGPWNSSHRSTNNKSSLEEIDIDTVDDTEEPSTSYFNHGGGFIMRGLAAILTKNNNLSKKERKGVRRRLCYFHDKTRVKQKAPEVENIHKGVGLKRHFAPAVDDPKNIETIYHCTKCECDMRTHTWGWCYNDTKTICKAKIHEGCSSGVLDSLVPICADCGHYLVDGIHIVDSTYNVATCTICEDFCVPEAQLLEQFRKEGESTNETISPELNNEDKILSMDIVTSD